jgi:DNA-binding CsgD family transcriptional regulator
MLQILNTLAVVKEHIGQLQSGMSEREIENWKRTALELLESAEATPAADRSEEDADGARLSPREREVMNMMLSGRRLKEIAAELGISVKTVTTHRARLLRKLKLSDNLGLYRYGIRTGIVTV